MTTTTTTTVTTPITISSTPLSPTQRKEVDLDAILDEAFSEFDSNATASTANTAGTAPAGGFGNAAESLSDLSLDAGESSQIFSGDLDEFLTKAFEEWSSNPNPVATNASPATTADGIPLPDKSHLKLAEESKNQMTKLLAQQLENMIKLFKQNSDQARNMVAPILRILTDAISGLFSQETERDVIYTLPSLNDQDPKIFMLFFDKWEDSDVEIWQACPHLCVCEGCQRKRQANTASSSTTPTKEQAIQKIEATLERFVQEGKAKALSLEEVKQIQLSPALREAEIGQRTKILVKLGFLEETAPAMIQHENFILEILMAVLYALAQEDQFLEGFKSVFLTQVLQLEDFSDNPLAVLDTFLTSEQSVRFKQYAKEYLVKYLQK